MKSKPGAAMVEMGDCYAVDRAITHLNNTFLFAQRMNVWWGFFFSLSSRLKNTINVGHFKFGTSSPLAVCPSSKQSYPANAMNSKTAQAVSKTSTVPGTTGSPPPSRRQRTAFSIRATCCTSSMPSQMSLQRFSLRSVHREVWLSMNSCFYMRGRLCLTKQNWSLKSSFACSS